MFDHFSINIGDMRRAFPLHDAQGSLRCVRMRTFLYIYVLCICVCLNARQLSHIDESASSRSVKCAAPVHSTVTAQYSIQYMSTLAKLTQNNHAHLLPHIWMLKSW
jgi:hypothetical protein